MSRPHVETSKDAWCHLFPLPLCQDLLQGNVAGGVELAGTEVQQKNCPTNYVESPVASNDYNQLHHPFRELVHHHSQPQSTFWLKPIGLQHGSATLHFLSGAHQTRAQHRCGGYNFPTASVPDLLCEGVWNGANISRPLVELNCKWENLPNMSK